MAFVPVDICDIEGSGEGGKRRGRQARRHKGTKGKCEECRAIREKPTKAPPLPFVPPSLPSNPFFRTLYTMLSLAPIFWLSGGCAVMMILEWRGLPTTLSLSFKGDIKRESRFLAQYGQSICTPIAGILIWQLDPSRRRDAVVIVVATIATSIVAMLIKRLLSRVRPGRPDAGKFLGPSWKHANYKESFPSSHSACAATLSALLAVVYPHAAATFWSLAIICAVLRYLMDAHWPSDVLGGLALGCGVAYGAVALTGITPG